MNTLFKKFERVYEETDADGDSLLEVIYDDSGCINAIYVYSQALGDMVQIDINAFEANRPSRYNYYQNKINAILSGKDPQCE